jgi:hypothetical protein
VNTGEPAEFALWLQRANDPGATEEERHECRELMGGYLRARMHEAFRNAAAENAPRAKPPTDV